MTWPEVVIGVWIGPTLSLMAVSVGAAGASVSTVRINGSLAGPVFPAVSVAVKRMLREPSSSAVSGVKVQLPEALTTVVPIS